ncbi:hypothetical protein BBP40_003335 [Aspergillus hancockii]|nr:hypothetical protein BBP40_003335 [Aspergillus hancockii]
MSFNHSVFDGTGAGKVLELLAQCCSGPREKALISAGDTQCGMRQSIANVFEHSAHMIDHSKETGPAPMIPEIPEGKVAEIMAQATSSLSTCRLIFAAARILHLKQGCSQVLSNTYNQTAVLNKDNGRSQFVSSNDVLTALLAISINRTRCRTRKPARQPDSVDIFTVVNMRERLPSPTFKDYLGNMAVPLRLTTFLHDFKSERRRATGPEGHYESIIDELPAITSLALMLREMVQSKDAQYFSSFISFIQSQGDWRKTSFPVADINFSSWRHLRAHSLEFGTGFGKVKSFDMLFGLFDGVCIVMPAFNSSEHQVSPWEVHITLNSDELDLFTDDELIRWLLRDSDLEQ